MTNRPIKLLAIATTLAAVGLAWRTSADLPAVVAATPDQRLRLDVRGPDSPVTVVFEIGLGGVLEEWAAVQNPLSHTTRTASYDRFPARHHAKLSGLEVAAELHGALRQANLQPPYLLVGQSFGAVYCRLFASAYPGEVAGLVLVDPTQEAFMQWLSQTHPKLNNWSNADMREWPELAGIDDTFAQLAQSHLPGVPVTVITGTIRGRDAQRDTLLDRWYGEHEAWVSKLPRGRHVSAEQAGHGVHVEQPAVVIDEIRRMIDSLPKR